MVTHLWLVTFSLGCRDVSRRTRILLAAVFTESESHHWRCTFGNTRAALFLRKCFWGLVLDKNVSGFRCVIKRVIACSLLVRYAWSRRERQLPFLLLLVSTTSGQGLNPTLWSVIRRATKSRICVQ